MLYILFLLLIGTIILYISGDFLIRGATLLAKRYNLNSFFVGATVVAFGTSAPEFFVSFISKIQGSNSIALGNILGSNIANLGIVLAISLIFAKKTGSNFKIPKIELILSLFIPVFLGISLYLGKIPKIISIIMLLILIYFIFAGLKQSIKLSKENKKEKNKEISFWTIILFVFFGTIGLPFGANLFINGAKGIALSMGVSELLVGVTITAIGTSLPELVASIVAIIKKDTQMSLGNVLGSNIMNFYGILGLVGTIFSIIIPKQAFLELISISILSILIIFIHKSQKKLLGITILLTYISYVIFVIYRT